MKALLGIRSSREQGASWSGRGLARRSFTMTMIMGIIVSVGVVIGGLAAPRTAEAVPLANPDLAAACGIDVVLVLDESGSISSATGGEAAVEAAVTSLVQGLENTGSRIRIVEFGTNGRLASVGGSTFFQEVTPALTAQVATYLTGGGFNTSATSYNPGSNQSNSDQQYTNWEAALDLAGIGEGPGELVVFLTDGQPNTVGTGGNSNGGASSAANAANAAEQELNLVKGTPNFTHVLGIGVGGASSNTNFNLLADTIEPGTPDKWEGTGTLDMRTVDAIRVTNFGALDDALQQVVYGLCAPSVTIYKVNEVGTNIPWDFAGSVDVAGGANDTYQWVSPNIGSPTTDDGTGDDAGQARSATADQPALFQWAPGSVANPQPWDSTFTFSETLPAGWSLPESQANCTGNRLQADGLVVPLDIGLSSATVGQTVTFTLSQVLQKGDIVSCTVVNLREPTPRVVKGAGEGNDILATLAEPGGSVVIPVQVFNDAPAPSGDATLTSLTDDIYGDITTTGHDGITATTCATGGTIAAGSSYSCSFTVDVDSQPGTVTDTVTATLTNAAAPNGVSDTDQANVVITDVDSVPLTIVKSTSTPSLPEPGGTFSYSVTITNGSSVDTATITSIDDTWGVAPATGPNLQDLTGLCATSGGAAIAAGDFPLALAPGVSITCDFTQAHFGNAGDAWSDDVVVVATDDDGADVGGDSNDVTVALSDVAEVPLTIVKSTSTPSLPEPGGTFSYSVTITNGSSVDTATITSIEDDVAGVLTGCSDADGVLAPGESTTCDFTFDHFGNAGDTFDNTVTVEATDDDGADVGGDSNKVTVTITDLPSSILVTKAADPASVPETGADVTFTVVVQNTSEVDAVTINTVDDTVFGDITASCLPALPATLAPGASIACEFVEPISGDYPGVHTNIVVAAGTDDDGNPVSDDDTAVVTYTDVLPDITVTKVANVESVPEPGADVTYTFTVTNNGTEAVTLDSLTDDKFFNLNGQGGCSVPQPLAGSGGTYSCSVTKFIGGNAGFVHTNVVTAVASDDDGNRDIAEATEDVTVTDVLSAIEVLKSADPMTVPEPGGDVAFTFTVNNVSAVDSVTIDSLSDSIYGDLNGQGDCVAPQTILAGGSYSCTLTALVDGNAGHVHTNVLTASGTDDDGNPLTGSDNATVTVVDVPSSIQIVKTATPDSVDEPGGFVTFSFTVTNPSAVDAVTIDSLIDSIYGDLNGQGTCDIDPKPVLAPAGGSYSCGFTVLVAGNGDDQHTNVVTVAGTDDDGNPVTNTDDATVAIIDVLPDISVTKTADLPTVPELGDDVAFTFVVTNHNSEPVTLTSLTDSVFGDLNGQGDCATNGTIPGNGGTYTCSVTEFIGGNAGFVHTNVVTAVAADDDGNSDQATDDETVEITDVPSAIQVSKTANPTSVPETGGDVTFTFTVNNLSAVDSVTINSLTDTIYGDLNGQGDCSVPQTIVVGGSYSCSLTTFVSGNAGQTHINVATASGTDDDGNPVTDDDDASVTLTDVLPDISITKTADPIEVLEPGDNVTFTFVVTNLNSEVVTLTSLSDSVFGDLNGQGDCATGGLIAGSGGRYTCSVTKLISGNAGFVHTNVVTAVASDDDGNSDAAEATEDVTVTDVLSAIEVLKSADPTTVPEPGGDVAFTFTVNNVSAVDSVTIDSLSDSIYGDLNGQGDCVTPQTILAGGSYSCTLTTFVDGNYRDVHTNVLTATGTDDDGNPVSGNDDAAVTVTDVPSSIDTTKTADPTSVPETGADVTYTVVVANTSTVDEVTINTVVDDIFGDVSSTCVPALPAVLAPGNSVTCTFSRFVSGDAPDVHTNVVTASGTDDDGAAVSDEGEADVVITDVLPDITVTKAADVEDVLEPGGDVTYTFTVRNNGTELVTLDSLADDRFGDLNGQGDCTTPQALTGSGGTYTCSVTKFIGGNAGLVHTNVVTATASDDDGNSDSSTATESVTVTDVPSAVEVVKTPSTTTVPEPGEDVTFTFTVTNLSDVDTVTMTELVDSVYGNLDGEGDCSMPQVLAPGAAYTCSLTRLIGNNAGDVHTNVVTITGTDDDGNPVTDTDDAEVSVTDVPSAVEVIKTASVTSVREPGADVTFTFTVTNLSAVDSVTVNSLTDDIYGDLNGQGTCSVPQALAAGESYTCSLEKFVGGVEDEIHTNVVTVSGADDDGNPVTDTDDEVVTIIEPLGADLQIVKTASVEQVGAGSGFDWILDVTNNGPGTAIDVEIGDIVPDSVMVTRVTSSDFDCGNRGNTVTCTVGSLASGESGTVRITVSVPLSADGGVVVNLGTVESDTPDPDLTNNSDDASVAIVAQAAPTTTLPPVTLPPTGSNSTNTLVQGAVWLLLLGAGGMLAARRRRVGAEPSTV